MKNNIFIPKIINVGYQNRSDTYTGKLAYVIYYDEKNVSRKEKSWQSWRDKNIPNNKFENIPMSGFVLNKKVGDCDTGWNHRHAYTRIYDPRNFEFEITVENLLYILENTNSIKGKGLEGEFIYGWDGKNLVLLPVDSPDYKQITEYNSIIHENKTIKQKDLITGATYLIKDNQEIIYMGKFDYYSSGYEWTVNGEIKTSKNYNDIPKNYDNISYNLGKDYKYINNYLYGKYLWFAYKYYDYDWVGGEKIYNSKFRWAFQKYKTLSNNKIIKCINENCTPEYAYIFGNLEKSCEYSPYDKTKDKDFNIELEDFFDENNYNYFISEYDGYKNTYLICKLSNTEEYEVRKNNKKNFSGKVFSDKNLKKIYKIMKPQYIQEYLKNGTEYRRKYTL